MLYWRRLDAIDWDFLNYWGYKSSENYSYFSYFSILYSFLLQPEEAVADYIKNARLQLVPL